MTLSDLHNPKQITGILLWNNGKPTEVEADECTAFQETNGCIELWQQMSENTILRVCRWYKRSSNVTHYIINNSSQFVPKFL